MNNSELAKLFQQMASLMELHDGNAFKIKAYQNAYNVIRKTETSLVNATYLERGKIPGIGKSINDAIEELKVKGSINDHQQLLVATPEGVVEMLNVKGLGPKKVKLIWEQLSIETIGEALQACQENRLLDLKGFRLKSQQDLEQKLIYFFESKGKFLLSKASIAAEEVMQLLLDMEVVTEIHITGQLRRYANTFECIELITPSDWNSQEEIIGDLVIKSISEYAVEGIYKGAYPVLIVLSTQGSLCWDDFVSTGSEAFCDFDLFYQDQYESEAEIFSSAGLSYVHPALREKHPKDIVLSESTLITEKAIKGIIHAHSTWSDGMHTIEQMAHYCQSQNLEYLVLTDHSKAAFYANGLSEERVIAQHAEIDSINAKMSDFKIFKGIEADILSDGSIDYGVDFIQNFEFVIASIHSNLTMDESTAMKRLIKAIEHPNVDMLGHLTGRLLLSRKGYPINHTVIIDACAANGVGIEINANPYRLDIDWRWIPYCIEKGVMLSINPDAHQMQGIHDIQYGVKIAQKGGLTATHCLSAKNLEAFSVRLKNKQ